MLRLAAFFSLLIFVTPGYAETIPKEIQGFKAINVNFSENAIKCNIKDPKRYQDHMFERLHGLGIKQDPNSIVEVEIDVTATPQGVSTCLLSTWVRFQTILTSQNVVTDNMAVRLAVDRLVAFPVTLWGHGVLAGREYYLPASGRLIDRAAMSVNEQVDIILERFKAERES